MALTEYKLGDIIEQVTETNSDNAFGPEDVRGMTITKQIIPTKADVSKTDLSGFLIIRPGEFVFNPRTHGKHIGFGYNNTDKSFIISWNNIGFRIKESMKNKVSSEYLFLHFNRDEWDREACYRSWGSSTEVFSWDALCEMKFELPPVDVQKKYAGIYNAMLENQQVYESALDDLKNVCGVYMEKLRKELPLRKIGEFITQKNEKNGENGIDFVMGLSTKKEFREAHSRVNRNDLYNYKVVRPNDIAFVPTTDTWKVLAFAVNEFDKPLVVSPIYEVFSVDQSKLLSQYLAVWLSRPEFDRYARYNSWGSARENFSFDDMREVKIPIPDMEIQRSVADIYRAYAVRKEINEELKARIKEICPILIGGSLKDGG